jgi:iron complex transport system ATP-binding protein
VKNKSVILSVNSLEIGYHTGKKVSRLISPLSANAREGELIAVLGRNGIGKSTLLRTLIGLQPFFGGEISLIGKNLNSYKKLDLAKLIGYISTEIVTVSNMRVYDLVALGRYPHTNWIGTIDPYSHQAIIHAINISGVTHLQNRFISELSDGERQKVMIARMIAQEAPIMIMDEPIAFLDISGKYDVVNLLLKLTRKGRTIIFSTHDFNVAMNQADKIWLLLEDKLIEGSPEDLMLHGAFNHLFDSSLVKFNPDDGNFSFSKEHQGTIYIKGSGLIKLWTEKAVMRAGYSIASVKTNKFIETPTEKNNKWILFDEEDSISFYSIYDLVNHLGSETLDFT